MGIYQGDPLLVVIFNTVINTLVDTVKSHPDLGTTINMLQYADDIIGGKFTGSLPTTTEYHKYVPCLVPYEGQDTQVLSRLQLDIQCIRST